MTTTFARSVMFASLISILTPACDGEIPTVEEVVNQTSEQIDDTPNEEVLISADECGGGQNTILHFVAEQGSTLWPGSYTVTTGDWTVWFRPDMVEMYISDRNGAWSYSIQFDSPTTGNIFTNPPLAVGTYEHVRSSNSQRALGTPGFAFGGSAMGCNTLIGRFEIQELTTSPGMLGPQLDAFAATFSFHCNEMYPYPAGTSGCVRWRR